MKFAPGNQLADRVHHGLRAEHQRFAHASRVEKTIGEDVPSIGIGGELDFVHREEIHVDIARHGLDRAHIVAGPLRLDFFLAGDQRHVVRADPRHDLVVDFARKQPQRQADQPALMAKHALDGEMGLACIRRSQNRRNMPGMGWLYGSRLHCCAHKRTFCRNRTLCFMVLRLLAR